MNLTDPTTVRWRNGAAILFHGTIRMHSSDIMRNGVKRASLVRTGGWDFGSGFYTTMSLDVAKDWADSVHEKNQPGGVEILPAVLKFEIPWSELNRFNIIFFTDACDNFWDYVHHCRASTHKHKRPVPLPDPVYDPYDIAAGPAVINPQSDRPMIDSRIGQVCFKTDAAIALFAKYKPIRVI